MLGERASVRLVADANVLLSAVIGGPRQGRVGTSFDRRDSDGRSHARGSPGVCDATGGEKAIVAGRGYAGGRVAAR